MVATCDFSELTSLAWAFASAAAKLAINSLDRCMAVLHGEEIETDGSGFRAFGADAMADRHLGILGNQSLKFGHGLFVFGIGRSGRRKDRGELRPGIGGAHVDDAHRLDARFRGLDPE